jgi:hypothetical protein
MIKEANITSFYWPKTKATTRSINLVMPFEGPQPQVTKSTTIYELPTNQQWK